MEIRELSIPGAWEFTPDLRSDPRGVNLEVVKSSEFTRATGRTLEVAQVNSSVSAIGALRGIHYTVSPPGQAKYVTCVQGAFLDVVVDLRPDSPTFGKWDSVLIDDVLRRSVFLSEGLGHAILALENMSTVLYFCSTEYNPGMDRDINPFDPDLAIDWPTTDRDDDPMSYILSEKDRAAPAFATLAAIQR